MPINGQLETSTDRRQQLRELTDAKITITWTDSDGENHSISGEAKDSSTQALLGIFPDPTPEGQVLSMRSTELGIFDLGTVRHSTPADEGFLIGIALLGDPKSG